MKKLVLLLVALLPFVAYADTLSKKELKRIEKDAKTEAKKLSEWKVLPGALPIQRQLEEAYKLQSAKEEGEPKYFIEDGVAVGESYNAAKLMAVDAAKQRIAANIETEIVGLIESSLSNQELSVEDAASLSKITSQSKSKFEQSLGHVPTVVELYQNPTKKTVKVMVRVVYSTEKARTMAKKVLYKNMEDESKELKDKLSDIVGW